MGFNSGFKGLNITSVTWESIFVSYVFFKAEFKYVTRTTLSPTVFCVREIFWNAILVKFSFFLSRYQYVLYMTVALYNILNIVWTWKLNHNKDSRHVSPITDSQTVQAQTVQTWWNMKPPVSSAWGTLHCRTAPW